VTGRGRALGRRGRNLAGLSRVRVCFSRQIEPLPVRKRFLRRRLSRGKVLSALNRPLLRLRLLAVPVCVNYGYAIR